MGAGNRQGELSTAPTPVVQAPYDTASALKSTLRGKESLINVKLMATKDWAQYTTHTIRSRMRSALIALASLGIIVVCLPNSAAAQTADVTERCSRARVLPFEQAKQLVLESPDPSTPALAKQANLRGIVHVEVCVSETGVVIRTDRGSGHRMLVPAAVESAKKWRFKPSVDAGEAVPFQTVLEISFLGTAPPRDINSGFFDAENACYDNLQANDLDIAAQYCQLAIRAAEALPPQRFHERWVVYALAGRVALAQQQFEAALTFFSWELDVARQNLEPNDREVALAYHHVALALHRLKRLQEAQIQYELAEAILAEAVEHTDLARKQDYVSALVGVLTDYLVLLQQSGQFARATDVEKELERFQ
jgi:TonB family protein